jgi:hypothetical protein
MTIPQEKLFKMMMSQEYVEMVYFADEGELELSTTK